MLDLHPDKFKKEWARVLIAAGIEPIAMRKLQKTIEDLFQKRYEIEVRSVIGTRCDGELLLFAKELEKIGLIEFLTTDSGLFVNVTRRGLEHVGMIVYLSRRRPDPYRKLTRPSYSPNYSSVNQKPTVPDLPIPAPSGWDRLPPSAPQSVAALPPLSRSNCW